MSDEEKKLKRELEKASQCVSELLCEAVLQEQKIAALTEGLEAVVRHQEIIAGAMAGISGTAAIAKRALAKARGE